MIDEYFRCSTDRMQLIAIKFATKNHSSFQSVVDLNTGNCGWFQCNKYVDKSAYKIDLNFLNFKSQRRRSSTSAVACYTTTSAFCHRFARELCVYTAAPRMMQFVIIILRRNPTGGSHQTSVSAPSSYFTTCCYTSSCRYYFFVFFCHLLPYVGDLITSRRINYSRHGVSPVSFETIIHF